MSTFQLLPFDDAVRIRTLISAPVISVTEVRSGDAVPTAQDPLDNKSYLFTSFNDGVYEVIISGSKYEKFYVVCNNKTLLLLEYVRASLLRQEVIFDMSGYELLLSLNYTAIDNWRIGEYGNTNAIYEYLMNYLELHGNVLNQLTNY